MSQDFLDGMAADHAAIHSESAEFSEKATIEYPLVLPTISQEVDVIFNEIYHSISPDTGLPVMSSNPNVLIYLPSIDDVIGTSFLSLISDGVRMIIRTVSYIVADAQPDGTGCYVIRLKVEPA